MCTERSVLCSPKNYLKKIPDFQILGPPVDATHRWGRLRTVYTAQNYMCLVLFEPGLCRLVGLLIGGVWVNDNNFCVDFGEGFGA